MYIVGGVAVIGIGYYLWNKNKKSTEEKPSIDNKNTKQREKYVSRRQPREPKPEKVPKPVKDPNEKITFPRQVRPFGIIQESREITFN